MTALDEPPGLIEVRPSRGLLRKIVDAAAAIENVEKDKRNDFHRYDYSSIEAIVKATRVELLNRGVLVAGGVDHVETRTRPTSQGESTITTAHLVYTVFDADTGEMLQVPWAGQGDDPADKGLSKALTDARKTFLIQLLNIARGDDTEGDPSTDERSAPTPKGAVNLSNDARGLSNAQLNAALVGAGLPAQQQPWGLFTRIPAESAAAVRELLAAERR